MFLLSWDPSLTASGHISCYFRLLNLTALGFLTTAEIRQEEGAGIKDYSDNHKLHKAQFIEMFSSTSFNLKAYGSG